MRLFFAFLIAILVAIPGFSQSFKKVPLSKEDKKAGVYLRFTLDSESGYSHIDLILKKDFTYTYSQSACMDHLSSEGRWKKEHGLLVFESTLSSDNIPVVLMDGADGRYYDSCNIAIVEGAHQPFLEDVYVRINNDSTACLPAWGKCSGACKSIYSVKLAFKNGMTSRWIPVKEGTRKVRLRILTEIPIWNYVVMDKWVFKLRRGLLISQ